ncbi:aspartic peptidase domain-containing protein [Exophiala viscosa]|uniref:Aspartic peptidase domain-containing protein n=1 Tax=Exophiala viscosa TaxID=2486360 RepID=A0AAN6IF86_9EURO|nr:aspartic peptidase domain-containing protein [Exophiala viscosa]
MATLAGLVLLASAVVANNCSIQPVYVDFHNRAVDGGITFQYGLFTGIGSPISQNLSSWPSLSNNETSVGSLDYCSTSSFQNCVNQSHGFYSPDLSQTYSSASSYKTLDNLGSIPATILETAYDTFNLFTHYFDPSPPNLTTISQFPLTVLSNYSANASPWFGPAGLLGLGPSSVLLQRLYDMNLISSRSFGLYMGTAYQQANGAMNGSLTLGGYDSGRFDGDVYNYTISSANSDGANSPFKVTIAQMTLTTADGNKTEFSNQFDAYITTSQYALTLPSAITQQFADSTGATASNDGLDVLQLPSGFDATLTITLAGGFNVTYDAQWLRNVSNNSPISAAPISSTSTNATSSPANLLGTAFLSSIYFMANYDSHPPQFQLASALTDAQFVQTQTLCPDTVPTPAPTTNISSFTRAGLTGAIIGGVIGGMGLTFVFWYTLRRCYQRRERRRVEAQSRNQDLDGTISVRPKSDGNSSDRTSSEMTTFAFDFNSSTHQAYQNYLRN